MNNYDGISIIIFQIESMNYYKLFIVGFVDFENVLIDKFELERGFAYNSDLIHALMQWTYGVRVVY